MKLPSLSAASEYLWLELWPLNIRLFLLLFVGFVELWNRRAQILWHSRCSFDANLGTTSSIVACRPAAPSFPPPSLWRVAPVDGKMFRAHRKSDGKGWNRKEQDGTAARVLSPETRMFYFRCGCINNIQENPKKSWGIVHCTNKCIKKAKLVLVI